jgi:hypothetical protein
MERPCAFGAARGLPRLGMATHADRVMRVLAYLKTRTETRNVRASMLVRIPRLNQLRDNIGTNVDK